MKFKKVKNLSNNLFYGLIYRMISLILPFIIRTVMIKTLSSEYLGLSSLFTSIVQALNLIELGIGSALVFNMYEPVAKNDIKKICAYMSFYKKCYQIIGTIVLIMGIVLVPFLQYFVNGSYPSDVNIYVIYFIYLINTVLTYWLFSYKNSVALAYQRTDIENKALIFSNTLMYILQIAVLFVFKQYYFYIILLPLFTIVKNIFISYKVDKEFLEISAAGCIYDSEKKEVISNIKSLFGHQIAFTVINSADSIILSSLLGLTELAIYNNYYYIFSAVVNILSIFFSSIQAGIGNDIIIETDDNIFVNFKRFRLIVFIAVNMCSMFLFALYQPFIKLWMGKDMLLSDLSAFIFVIGFYITQIRRVVTTYKNASGMWKEDFLKPYIVILVDIIIDIILINKLGSIGAMISTILSMGLIAIPWEICVLYKYLFNKKIYEYLIFLGKEILLFIVNISLLYFVLQLVRFNGVFEICVKAIIAFITTCFIMFLFHYNDPDFKWAFKRILILIKNKE